MISGREKGGNVIKEERGKKARKGQVKEYINAKEGRIETKWP
jgi:hypothetical protein